MSTKNKSFDITKNLKAKKAKEAAMNAQTAQENEQLEKMKQIEMLKTMQQHKNLQFNARINALNAATSTHHTDEVDKETIVKDAEFYYEWIMKELGTVEDQASERIDKTMKVIK